MSHFILLSFSCLKTASYKTKQSNILTVYISKGLSSKNHNTAEKQFTAENISQLQELLSRINIIWLCRFFVFLLKEVLYGFQVEKATKIEAVCEVFEWRVWRIWELVKQWKSCPKGTNSRLKWMLNKSTINQLFPFSKLWGIRNDYFLMSVCAIQDHLLGFDCNSFCASSSIHHGPTQVCTKHQSSNFWDIIA